MLFNYFKQHFKFKVSVTLHSHVPAKLYSLIIWKHFVSNAVMRRAVLFILFIYLQILFYLFIYLQINATLLLLFPTSGL